VSFVWTRYFVVESIHRTDLPEAGVVGRGLVVDEDVGHGQPPLPARTSRPTGARSNMNSSPLPPSVARASDGEAQLLVLELVGVGRDGERAQGVGAPEVARRLEQPQARRAGRGEPVGARQDGPRVLVEDGAVGQRDRVVGVPVGRADEGRVGPVGDRADLGVGEARQG
jgi:hypothetical protein